MNAELEALLARIEDANLAFLSGDPGPYMALFEASAEASFYPPFGGPALKGWAEIEPRMAAASSLFLPGASGTVRLESSVESGDLLLLVLRESSRVVTKTEGERDWQVRATLVLRRQDGNWRILHRHADRLAERAAKPTRG